MTGGDAINWKKLLAYITGSVDEELLLRNEHLVIENRILRAQIKGPLKLTDGERRTLAEIGKKLGRKVLAEVGSIVKPETILAWHRRLVANPFAGRWIESAIVECLSNLILVAEKSLRRTLNEYVAHHHGERPHQGKGNVVLFPSTDESELSRPIRCRERLGGLLKYYHRAAG